VIGLDEKTMLEAELAQGHVFVLDLGAHLDNHG
jgi:hypothetical protein